MFDEYLKTLASDYLIEKSIYIINLGESRAEVMMKHLYEKYPDLYIGTYMQDFGIIYRLKGTNKVKIESCLTELKTIFNDYYVCESDDPINYIVNYLCKNNLSISFAESCTAGLAASLIASIPGSSNILSQSYTTYSQEAKNKILGVAKTTLNKQGVYSKQCAYEMVLGLKKITDAKINIAITGIAGPDGGSEDNPIGSVYFCLDFQEQQYHYQQIFSGDRNLIRTKAAKFIIMEAYRLIKCLI
jgi:nicotinamide-nucleotide amidase